MSLHPPVTFEVTLTTAEAWELADVIGFYTSVAGANSALLKIAEAYDAAVDLEPSALPREDRQAITAAVYTVPSDFEE